MKPSVDHPYEDWLQLSVRLRNALAATGRTTIGDLCDMTPEQVLGLRNIGMTNLRELERELAASGFSLRPGEAKRGVPKDKTARALALLHSLEYDLEQLKRRVAACRSDLLRDARSGR